MRKTSLKIMKPGAHNPELAEEILNGSSSSQMMVNLGANDRAQKVITLNKHKTAMKARNPYGESLGQVLPHQGEQNFLTRESSPCSQSPVGKGTDPSS
jgi:hypothetical protein